MRFCVVSRLPGTESGGAPPVVGTFDFYISPTGTGSAASGGTLANPWPLSMLNNSTAQARYRTKRIGVMDGTYNLYAAIQAFSGDPGFEPVFEIDGGSAGTPTVLKAVNRGLAIFACDNAGTITTNGYPVLGQLIASHMGYVTIDGIKFSKFGSKCIYLGNYGVAATTATRYGGYIVQNCEFSGQDTSVDVNPGNNYSGIELAGARQAQVINNYFHGLIGHESSVSTDHCTSTLQWFGEQNLYEYNTCLGPGFYGKEVGNFGTTIRYNFVDATGYTKAFGAQDFGDEDGGTFGVTTSIHHNIFIAQQCIDIRGTHPGTPFNDPVEIYSNTILIQSSAPQGLGICGHFAAGKLSCYNNIIYSAASGDLNHICVNTSADGVIDYDLYYSSNGTYNYGNFSSPTNTTRNGTSNFATWQSTMGGTPEANKGTNANPIFLNTGADAEKYQIDASSPAWNAGKSDGTSGSTTVHRGAWGNSPPSRIGYSAAA